MLGPVRNDTSASVLCGPHWNKQGFKGLSCLLVLGTQEIMNLDKHPLMILA